MACVAASIGAAATVAHRPSVATTTSCSPNGVVATPSRGSYDDLLGISALSNEDVWTVGRYINSHSQDRTLIEHWGGTRFAEVPSANPQPNDLLYGVDAISASNVWAVGATFPAKHEVFSTLIEHWDGSAWRTVKSPPLASGSGVLASVSGQAPDDVWAVGTMLSGVTDTEESTLVEHWDGTSWSVVASPDPDRYGNALDSVAVVSASDLWAAGTSYKTRFGTVTLIEHWNGAVWSVVPSPDVNIDDSLVSISAVDAKDVWAVGDDFYNTSTGSQVNTLAEHFDGARWRVVGSPSPSGHDNLLAVAAVQSDDVWAVGGTGSPGAALLEHWNGTNWTVASEPYRHGNANYLHALSTGRPPGVWAAGSFGGSGSLALVEHFCRG